MPKFIIPESCRELAALQVTQWPADPDAFDWITEKQLTFTDHITVIPKRVVELGCGLGRIACGLNRKWPGCEFVLADHNAVDSQLGYGWNPGDERYNYLDRTAEFCEANGLTNYLLHELDAGDDRFDADLIVSFLAVGFHWPLEQWLPKLKAPMMVFGCRAGKYKPEDLCPPAKAVMTYTGFCAKEKIHAMLGCE